MNKSSLFFFLIGLVLLHFNYCKVHAFEFPDATIDGIEGVIIPPEYVERHKKLFRGGDFIKSWTPTLKELAKVNLLLTSHLEKRGDKNVSEQEAEFLRTHHRKTRRQYVGLITKTGKIIHINVIPLAPVAGADIHADWKGSYVFMYDGGAAYWQIDYHLDSATLKDLAVNQDS